MGGYRCLRWALVLVISSSCIVERGYGFSASSSSDAATLAQNRLRESLSSMSGKLTLSAELVIPDPTDPTALLLLATEVQSLSQNIRVSSKANAAFIEVASLSSLSTFCREQESARGNFPGPVPVIYCPKKRRKNNDNDDGDDDDDTTVVVELKDVAAAGASGVLVPLMQGEEELTCVADIADKVGSDIVEYCAKALQCGLQPIPEIVLSKKFLQQQDDQILSSLVDAVIQTCHFPTNNLPAAIVLSASLKVDNNNDDDDDDNDNNDEVVLGLPRVSKELKKRVPILASVRVMAGASRMGSAVADLKEAGYTGAALRSECVPGYRMNPDLKAVGNFWNACISDLKSVKSKSFAGFRANISMDKSVPMEWLKYQKDVIDSGALGDASGPPEDLDDLNSDEGDFVGF
uniref:Indole-3-glycerol-phosphate synthase n=2 Tax=Eucampia antarctica TaxID=49252 RepID=A0A7S2R1L6_9STRA|mmetsp:Transcript_12887/g.12503  ORF Transcript_12887/g.12503 Transcript_12887/m.12503 type:complete len:405 (+) Transcript_12887:60-1274(+)